MTPIFLAILLWALQRLAEWLMNWPKGKPFPQRVQDSLNDSLSMMESSSIKMREMGCSPRKGGLDRKDLSNKLSVWFCIVGGVVILVVVWIFLQGIFNLR